MRSLLEMDMFDLRERRLLVCLPRVFACFSTTEQGGYGGVGERAASSCRHDWLGEGGRRGLVGVVIEVAGLGTQVQMTVRSEEFELLRREEIRCGEMGSDRVRRGVVR